MLTTVALTGLMEAIPVVLVPTAPAALVDDSPDAFVWRDTLRSLEEETDLVVQPPVRIEDGEAWVAGVVPTNEDRIAVLEVLNDQPGIHTVHDDLDIGLPVAHDAMLTAMVADAIVPYRPAMEDVEIEVDNAEVRISGTIHQQAALTDLTYRVHQLPGTALVVTDLDYVPTEALAWRDVQYADTPFGRQQRARSRAFWSADAPDLENDADSTLTDEDRPAARRDVRVASLDLR